MSATNESVLRQAQYDFLTRIPRTLRLQSMMRYAYRARRAIADGDTETAERYMKFLAYLQVGANKCDRLRITRNRLDLISRMAGIIGADVNL